MKTPDALAFAQERELDLVEVAPEARPPVCRVLDYSKYKYEQAQKQKAARKHQQQITVREIKFRPKIAEHDYDTKKHHVERFLRHKDKVKITIMFRGREVTHPERGTAILDRLAEELSELGVVEQRPMQEGRNMTMMMAPSKAVLAGSPGAARARRVRVRARARPLRPPPRVPPPRPKPPRPRRPRPRTRRLRLRPSQPLRLSRPPRPSQPRPLRPPRPRSPPPSRPLHRRRPHSRRPRPGRRRRSPCSPRDPSRAPHRPPRPRGIIAVAMPKMKTHSGAKKRFKVTARGKVRGRHAFTSHILEKKSPRRSAPSDARRSSPAMTSPRVKRMLGAGK